MTKHIMSVNASMSLYRSTLVPGKLNLYDDIITFEAHGPLAGTEVKDTFLLDEIKSIKSGISIVPFRIVIMEKNGESWLFDQVNRQEAKAFVKSFKAAVGE
ncbi:hypothetical protein [Macrococcoides caseolyticum]|uniref:hypothetical protein n=1 Tax=Macrococcoides caseolyticum TaxID=69966 RepID=UPI001F25D2D2|nr:hypothetical protein [Macrococcus caseolyticus]